MEHKVKTSSTSGLNLSEKEKKDSEKALEKFQSEYEKNFKKIAKRYYKNKQSFDFILEHKVANLLETTNKAIAYVDGLKTKLNIEATYGQPELGGPFFIYIHHETKLPKQRPPDVDKDKSKMMEEIKMICDHVTSQIKTVDPSTKKVRIPFPEEHNPINTGTKACCVCKFLYMKHDINATLDWPKLNGEYQLVIHL
uniref:Uncharacterized protein n=1 Tax=viral metagenome TaxID=1070528 RepID=A0A6C0CM91_9ZZZZ